MAHHPEQYPTVTEADKTALRAEVQALEREAGRWEQRAAEENDSRTNAQPAVLPQPRRDGGHRSDRPRGVAGARARRVPRGLRGRRGPPGPEGEPEARHVRRDHAADGQRSRSWHLVGSTSGVVLSVAGEVQIARSGVPQLVKSPFKGKGGAGTAPAAAGPVAVATEKNPLDLTLGEILEGFDPETDDPPDAGGGGGLRRAARRRRRVGDGLGLADVADLTLHQYRIAVAGPASCVLPERENDRRRAAGRRRSRRCHRWSFADIRNTRTRSLAHPRRYRPRPRSPDDGLIHPYADISAASPAYQKSPPRAGCPPRPTLAVEQDPEVRTLSVQLGARGITLAWFEPSAQRKSPMTVRRVSSPIAPGDRGDRVAALHTALRALVTRGGYRVEPAPNRPTREELDTLVAELGSEREDGQSEFREATRTLVLLFQVQHGSGPPPGHRRRPDRRDHQSRARAPGRPRGNSIVVGHGSRREWRARRWIRRPGARSRPAVERAARRGADGRRRPLRGGLRRRALRRRRGRERRRPGGRAERRSELARSEVRFNAAPPETIDITLADGVLGVSEYERYLAQLEPALAGGARRRAARGRRARRTSASSAGRPASRSTGSSC